MRGVGRALPILAAALTMSGCLGSNQFALLGMGSAASSVPPRPEIIVRGSSVVVETPPAMLGRMEMVNATGWDVELTLERVGRAGLTTLGRIKAGERRILENLPSGVWVAIQARSTDGSRVLQLPAFPLEPYETAQWTLSPGSPWTVAK